MLPVLAVNTLIVWSLLAVGAVYAWGAIPLAVGAGALALWIRPSLGGWSDRRWLDGALIALLGAAAVQLVPLPAAALDLLSPSVAAFDARYRVDSLVAVPSLRPLSLDPLVSVYTLGLTAGIILLFWSARCLFAGGGVRQTVRVVSGLGLAVSLLAIAQRAVAPGYVYGLWSPLDEGASPIGPVVNANQFGAWLLVALPLSVGYLVAHLETHSSTRRDRSWRPLVRHLSDVRGMFLGAGAVLMGLALLFSGSRSAIAGLVAAVAYGGLIGRRRAGTSGRRVFFLLVLLLAAAAWAWLNLDLLAERFNRLDSGLADRAAIWHDTLSVAGQFWLTGVGLGAYQTAMVVYQTATHEVFFNHAHSQYLQLAMEGGLLLFVPAAIAIAALVSGARASLAVDQSPVWNIRAGAASGLVAVAVQSLWEPVLRMPANGVLIAVAAAILLHRPPGRRRD